MVIGTHTFIFWGVVRASPAEPYRLLVVLDGLDERRSELSRIL